MTKVAFTACGSDGQGVGVDLFIEEREKLVVVDNRDRVGCETLVVMLYGMMMDGGVNGNKE
jgi:hypothetical protein